MYLVGETHPHSLSGGCRKIHSRTVWLVWLSALGMLFSTFLNIGNIVGVFPLA